jgi:CRISPR type III-A-associated RAMP protein Csm4
MSQASHPGLVVKLRPTGPWRIGPDSGAREEVDLLYHSDSLYSAVTGAMRLLGMLDGWLDATARNPAGPAVRFSSLYPFQNEIGFVIPPRTVWPPAASTKVRWKAVRFIPLGLVAPLLKGHAPEEDQWEVDGATQCLVPAGRTGPFRTTLRSSAAVDRLSGRIEPHRVASIEFLPGAGLWVVIAFAGEAQQERWQGPVRAAFRLLADSGLGGERSRGWGRSEPPEFIEGSLPQMILPETAAEPATSAANEAVPGDEAPTADETGPAEPPPAYWLLSLFSPAPVDAVDWNHGNYSVVTRGGRIESAVRSGELKKMANMVSEGSVLVAPGPVQGAAMDVAPDGFAHPVYRAGFALAIPIPLQAAA